MSGGHLKRDRVRRRGGPAIALGAGAVLLMLAAPRLVSAIVQLPGDYVLSQLESGRMVDDGALARLAATRRDANEWTSDGRQWIGLGLAVLRRAEHAPGDRRTLLDGAVSALRHGLARRPADSAGWLWLAEAQLLRDGASSAVAKAIEMSIRTAPHDRRYYMARLEIALTVWPHFAPESRRTIAGQVRFASRIFPGELQQLTRKMGYGDIVQDILGVRPAG